MSDTGYQIRPMSRSELKFAIDWAGDEGWNPGIHDAECFYVADPEGYFIGLLDGEPVACVSMVKYDASFGFAGFYIVKPEHRGNRYGIQICNHGLDYLKGCNIGCDGVVEQQENYKKIGFKLAYRNVRYEGKGGGDSTQHPGLVDLSTRPFAEIAAYDRRFFPAPRNAFLRTWIAQPGSRAIGMVEDDRLTGTGVIRKCQSGYKIGPLFADRPDVAETLFLSLRSLAGPDDPIYLDTPEINPEAIALAKRHSMEIVFETARMYSGGTPDIDLAGIYGVTTFELG